MMVQLVSRETAGNLLDVSDVQDVHAQVRENIQHLMDRFLFGDWQKVTPHDLQQAAAHIRSIKIRYLVSDGHEVSSSAPLSALNELYLQLCLALDSLAGKDVKQQERLYRAILTLEAPLLSAHTMLPPVSAPSPEQNVPSVRVIPAHNTHQEEPRTTKPLSPEEPSGPLSLHQRFRWTAEKVRHLKQAYEQGSYPSVAQAATEIAEAFGWPLQSVRTKLYELNLKPKDQQQDGEEGQHEGSQAKEGD